MNNDLNYILLEARLKGSLPLCGVACIRCNPSLTSCELDEAFRMSNDHTACTNEQDAQIGQIEDENGTIDNGRLKVTNTSKNSLT